MASCNLQPNLERLNALISESDLSIIRIAEMLNITRDKLNRIRTGKQKKGVSPDIIKQLSKILGCTTDYLLGKADATYKFASGKTAPVSFHVNSSISAQISDLATKDSKLFDSFSYIMRNFTSQEKKLVNDFVDIIRTNHNTNNIKDVSEYSAVFDNSDYDESKVNDLKDSDSCKK